MSRPENKRMGRPPLPSPRERGETAAPFPSTGRVGVGDSPLSASGRGRGRGLLFFAFFALFASFVFLPSAVVAQDLQIAGKIAFATSWG